MKILDTIKYDYHGKNYEIRILQVTNGYIVRAFLNGKPANGYSYSVDFYTQIEFEWIKNSSVYSHLIEIAKQDIASGRWDKFIQLTKK